MAQSKTVILEREGIAEQIRAAIAESEIPEGERVLLCSPALMAWIVRRLGMLPEAEMRRQLGADMIGLGYLEDRKILVTSRETARWITGK
ncbi:MAG: hypothetical protein SPK76_04050 [Bacteroidales bacterium]|nr:hypothetical protein [Bacteroidales bacterium]